jgi:8-oxo-dGTP diphosphatase
VFDVAVTYILRHSEAGSQVLLGEKLTGLGIGKIVGPGGKSVPGESPRETAVREIMEEVGLAVSADLLNPIAVISYPFVDRPELSQRSFVFTTTLETGEPADSPELAARWWPLDEIPFDRMWADAKLWLPHALSGVFINATVFIGRENDVLSHDIPAA